MDTKKYIIEIPDNTAWLQWVKVSDKDGHVCFDFKDPEDLTPYTELDLEAIRNEAYEKGAQDTKQHLVDAPRSFAYKLGYESGLNAAWDAARKIVHLQWDGAWAGVDEVEKWFDTYTASEAIEKIRQYEHEQEEIKKGDEVQHRNHSGIKVIVLEKDGDAITAIAITNVPFACEVGDMYINRDAKDWKRTGKHYDIAEVLRKIHEEEP